MGDCCSYCTKRDDKDKDMLITPQQKYQLHDTSDSSNTRSIQQPDIASILRSISPALTDNTDRTTSLNDDTEIGGLPWSKLKHLRINESFNKKEFWDSLGKKDRITYSQLIRK